MSIRNAIYEPSLVALIRRMGQTIIASAFDTVSITEHMG